MSWHSLIKSFQTESRSDPGAETSGTAGSTGVGGTAGTAGKTGTAELGGTAGTAGQRINEALASCECLQLMIKSDERSPEEQQSSDGGGDINEDTQHHVVKKLGKSLKASIRSDPEA